LRRARIDPVGIRQEARTGAGMEIAIIGEAAGRVSREVIESAPGIPWPKMVSMRNRLTHGYSEINFDILWDTVTASLPSLVTELKRLLTIA
jgi:uncharacterized protein with HEPN domain